MLVVSARDIDHGLGQEAGIQRILWPSIFGSDFSASPQARRTMVMEKIHPHAIVNRLSLKGKSVSVTKRKGKKMCGLWVFSPIGGKVIGLV
jgi:hypothetical protein